MKKGWDLAGEEMLVGVEPLRVANTEELIALANDATALDYNRQLNDLAIRSLDPEGLHVLRPILVHHHKNRQPSDPHIRCEVLMKMEGQKDPAIAYLDVSPAALEELPLASEK